MKPNTSNSIPTVDFLSASLRATKGMGDQAQLILTDQLMQDVAKDAASSYARSRKPIDVSRLLAWGRRSHNTTWRNISGRKSLVPELFGDAAAMAIVYRVAIAPNI